MTIGIYLVTSTVETKPVSFGRIDSVSAVLPKDSSSILSDSVKVDIDDSANVKSITTYLHPEYGIASWYGDPTGRLDPYHGRKTASGVKFNSYEMWAAHKTLPFGSMVRVSTKKDTIVVQIVDRGPFVKGRIIDLSWQAQKELKAPTCTKVCVERIFVDGKPLIKEIKGEIMAKQKKKKKHRR